MIETKPAWTNIGFFKSLSFKFILAIVILVALFSSYVIYQTPHSQNQIISAMMLEKAEMIFQDNQEEIGLAILSQNQLYIDTLISHFVEMHQFGYMVVTEPNGEMHAKFRQGNPSAQMLTQLCDESHNHEDAGIFNYSNDLVIADQIVGRLIVGMPYENAAAFVAKSRIKAIIASVLVMIIGLIFIFALTRTVTMPLHNLTKTIDIISDGDLSPRFSEDRSDEIGMLVKSLNSMLDNWEEAQYEWSTLSHDLEQRVKHRTVELQSEISERKRAEEELKVFMAKLEQSNKELEEFAFVASHDLQEPLRKVQAFGDRLKSACAADLSDKGKMYLDRMQSAAERMQILIRDLLTFSRVTSKAQPFVEIDLNRVVKEVLSDLEVSIEQKQAKIELDELPVLEADALQMRQLLQNLIGNGMKFHKPDQPPVIRIYSQMIKERRKNSGSAVPGDQLCQIFIQDNGIGFDEKYVDRIFTVFQRLHGRSEYEGTGVGLAVCRKIVERHNGSITAKSQPGEGSTFVITIPTKQVSNEEQKARAQKAAVEEVIEEIQKPKPKAKSKTKEVNIPSELVPNIMQPVT